MNDVTILGTPQSLARYLCHIREKRMAKVKVQYFPQCSFSPMPSAQELNTAFKSIEDIYVDVPLNYGISKETTGFECGGTGVMVGCYKEFNAFYTALFESEGFDDCVNTIAYAIERIVKEVEGVEEVGWLIARVFGVEEDD